MKKVVMLLGIIAIISCSNDDNDCSGSRAEINAKYEEWLSNENLSQKSRTQLNEEWQARLENACD